jgi:hypothetical protein
VFEDRVTRKIDNVTGGWRKVNMIRTAHQTSREGWAGLVARMREKNA